MQGNASESQLPHYVEHHPYIPGHGWAVNHSIPPTRWATTATVTLDVVSVTHVPHHALIGYWHNPLIKQCLNPPSGFCDGRYVINEF